MWRFLDDDGVFINPVIPPAVPPNDCLVRTSFMATHTDEQLNIALEKFEKIGEKLGVNLKKAYLLLWCAEGLPSGETICYVCFLIRIQLFFSYLFEFFIQLIFKIFSYFIKCF